MLSIIIPTLQKRVDLLENLIRNLNNDSEVGEIIVIDNSTKGLNFSYDKLRVIIPKENLFVNPSWNLGVKEANYEFVGLLNDDIIICENFCSDLMSEIKELSMGVCGISKLSVEPVENPDLTPNKECIKLEKIDFIDSQFGIAMFFKKEFYTQIPDDLKIWYGDCFIFEKFKEKNLQNYIITGQKVYHFGSLTSSSKDLSPIYKTDKKVWNKIKYKWYDYIFKIEEYNDCIKMRFLRLNIRLRNKN